MQVLLSLRELFGGRTWKRLYICGRSGIGKTFIKQQGCKNLGFSKFYLPVSGNFFFATYRPELYGCVLFEEFGFNVYKSNFWQLKKVLERRPFDINVKFRNARSMGDPEQLQLVHFIPL
jgi:hypothetical protein